MTHSELLTALEQAVKATNPDESLGTLYARMYGILSANITEEQLTEILNRWESK